MNALIKIIAVVTLLIATIFIAVILSRHNSVEKQQEHVLVASPSLKENDLTIMGQLGRGQESGDIDETGPIVRIRSQGKVKGTILKSREGRDYFAFYQIPYAAEPVGQLRYEPPQKPTRWRNIRDATKPGSACIQRQKYASINTTIGEEACLHLNVYTPMLPKGRLSRRVKLPTMLYLHGGGPSGNGTRYGAKYLMDRNVILITIEFRIGAFGSFVTRSGSYSGNQGYKDQVAALEWVKRNIDRFGGDPDKVVLFGNSAGSCNVHAHLLSSMSKGLFSRAIMQSGTMVIGGVSVADPQKRSDDAVAAVGCLHETEEQVVACMKTTDAKPMAMGQAYFMSSGTYPDVLPQSPKERQKLLDDNQVFLTDTAWNLMNQQGIHQVPVMMGIVSQENLSGPLALFLTTQNGTNLLNDHWNEIFPIFTGIRDDENSSAAQAFRKVYFGDKPIDFESRLDLFNLQSDLQLAHATRIAALLYKNHSSPAPVYMYWITKEAAASYSDNIRKIFPPPYGGPSHADELQYIFLYEGYPEIGVDSPWFNISKSLVNAWVDFAESGQPRYKSGDWPQIDVKDNGMKWFELGDQMGIREPFTQRMELFDKYTQQLYAEESDNFNFLLDPTTFLNILNIRLNWEIDPSSIVSPSLELTDHFFYGQ